MNHNVTGMMVRIMGNSPHMVANFGYFQVGELVKFSQIKGD
jgi:hypothetical protein